MGMEINKLWNILYLWGSYSEILNHIYTNILNNPNGITKRQRKIILGIFFNYN